MQRPTHILDAEHRVIEKALACVDALCDRAGREGTVDVQAGRTAVAFIREFADGRHHAKEEDLLFPALEARGMPAHAGPTAVMRHEHEQGRAAVRGMAQALDAAEAGEEGAAEAFCKSARGYVLLLRDHIAKEDQVLFPMAEGMLPPAELEQLHGRFTELDADGGGQDWARRVDELCGSLGLDPSALPTANAGPGCCGC